ncbi:MAG: hypothetical protein M3Y18_01515 [Candidatus Eremiobacteraeota bacterium]|nr:hypothetical protein [Candidatus Eremiobacteraeota bacterium]
MNYEKIAQLSQIISAVVFIVAMVWIWMKLIAPAVLAAQADSNRRIQEAERHREEAKATLASLQGEIEAARSDAASIAERAKGQAQRERENVLRETREAGDRTVKNAGAELGRSRESARAQLRSELLEKALSVARGEATRRLDDAANASLVEEFIASLERGEHA